jgi:hypothetical protein
LYQALLPLSEAIVAALPVARDSHPGGALPFFFHDARKVLLLLTGVVFVMGMVKRYFTASRTCCRQRLILIIRTAYIFDDFVIIGDLKTCSDALPM